MAEDISNRLFFDVADADEDERFLHGLEAESTGRSPIWRQLASRKVGMSPNRPILLGDLSELEVEPRGIRRIF